VKSSLKNLAVQVGPDVPVVTFLPEAELFGFPFAITTVEGTHLGERTACATSPSLSWLGKVRQIPMHQTHRLEAWLGSPVKSPFDVLKVRDGLLPVIQSAGGKIHDSDTPEPLYKADVAILLSHGSRSLGHGFGGIPELFGTFTIDDLAGYLGHCQCVILFVCHAGRSDDRLHNQETFGLVARLLSRRVRLVVAPSWPLNNAIPAVWLPPFLLSLKSEKTANVALADAAHAVRSRFSNPCAWGAMQGFGDSGFRFAGTLSDV
jgi:hypothetical protein